MSVKEDLIAAKALIDTPEKWLKGKYENNDCFCALGAIRKTVFGTTVLQPVRARTTNYNFVVWALVSQLPGGMEMSVVSFNDAPSTTHADILALFDRAISACDGSPS